MKKTTLIILGCIWLGLGCGTVKSWLGFDKEPHEERVLPPSQESVTVDENGDPIFTNEQLAPAEKPWNSWGTVLLVSFLVGTGFIVRYVVKNRKK